MNVPRCCAILFAIALVACDVPVARLSAQARAHLAPRALHRTTSVRFPSPIRALREHAARRYSRQR